jgi:hypothetical protein
MKPAPIQIATFSQRCILQVLDALILAPFSVYVYFWGPQRLAISHHSVFPLLCWHFLGWILLGFLISRLGGTPAALLLKFRITSYSGQNLHFFAALIRCLPQLIRGLLATLCMSFLISHLPNTPSLILDRPDIMELMALHAGGYFVIYRMMNGFGILDLAVLFFNAHGRSLTDFLSGSYVRSA